MTLFRKPSENKGSETQQNGDMSSGKIGVLKPLVFGTVAARGSMKNPALGDNQGGANQESARSHRALKATLPSGLRGTIHGYAI
jgi:hypothetical protein